MSFISNERIERITKSGVIIDIRDPGADERLTIHDVAWALRSLRWGGHNPRNVSIASHMIAGSRWMVFDAGCGYTFLDALAFAWHDAAEAFVGDLTTTVKHMPEMAAYRALEDRCLESLVRRFAPELVGYDWTKTKQVDRMCLAREASWFPDTDDRRAHAPFYGEPPLPERHYADEFLIHERWVEWVCRLRAMVMSNGLRRVTQCDAP